MRESALAILFYAVVLAILAALVAEMVSHGDSETAREPDADALDD